MSNEGSDVLSTARRNALRATASVSHLLPHYNRMKGETVLQFHGIGPFDIVYMDPEDDPTREPSPE